MTLSMLLYHLGKLKIQICLQLQKMKLKIRITFWQKMSVVPK